MTYLVDANVLSEATKPQPQAKVIQWLRDNERDIVVEVTLFSNTYEDRIWALNPLRAANNVNGVGTVEWPDYTSLVEATLVERQRAFVNGSIDVLLSIRNQFCQSQQPDEEDGLSNRRARNRQRSREACGVGQGY